jgi:hypothetical protein
MKIRCRSFFCAGQLRLALILASTVVPGLAPADSLVAAWGRNDSYTTYGPTWLFNVQAIAVTYRDNLAVISNGVVQAWAQTGPLLQNVYYPGLSNAVAVAGGASYYLALHADGTVTTCCPGANTAPPLSAVKAIAAGWSHFLALKSNGTVVAWGTDTFGQTNVPGGLSNVTAIAAGDYHSLALKQDGTIVAWGSNADGQTNVPAGLGNIIAIAAGAAHNLAVDANGRVIAWGDNSGGQTNVPLTLSNVRAVAAGTSHSAALKSDGTVVAWGDNSAGQTNVPSGLSHVVAISARGDGNLALLYGDIPPFISIEPVGGTAPPGIYTNSLCVAQGSPPLAYQWRHNGTNIAGGTLTIVPFNPTQISQLGEYSALVRNFFGSQQSKAAIWVITASTNLSLLLRPVGPMGGPPGFKSLFQVQVCDNSGNCYLPAQSASLQLEASTNLLDWAIVPGGLILTNGVLLVQDSEAAAFTTRFYRVVQQ